LARLTYADASGFWRNAKGTLFFSAPGFSQKPMMYRVPPEQAERAIRRNTWLEYGQQFLIEPFMVWVYAAAPDQSWFWYLFLAYALLGRPTLQAMLVLRGLEKTGVPAPLETKLPPVPRSIWWRVPAAMVIAILILIYCANPDRPVTWETLWPGLAVLGALGVLRLVERAIYRRMLARQPA
jgi:hypothetical protein